MLLPFDEWRQGQGISTLWLNFSAQISRHTVFRLSLANLGMALLEGLGADAWVKQPAIRSTLCGSEALL